MGEILLKHLLFVAGFLLQAYFFVFKNSKETFDIKKISQSLLAGLVCSVGTVTLLLPALHKLNEILIASLYGFLLGFGAGIAMYFRKNILSKTHSLAFLTLNIIFVYYLISRLGLTSILSLISISFTFVSALILILRQHTPSFLKAFFGVWYIILMLGIGFINIHFVALEPTELGFAPVLFAGMIALYVYAFVVYLMFLLPLPVELLHQKGPKTSMKHLQVIASSFQKTPLSTVKMILLLTILIAVLAGNYHFEYISNVTLVLGTISFLSLLEVFIFKKSK